MAALPIHQAPNGAQGPTDLPLLNVRTCASLLTQTKNETQTFSSCSPILSKIKGEVFAFHQCLKSPIFFKIEGLNLKNYHCSLHPVACAPCKTFHTAQFKNHSSHSQLKNYHCSLHPVACAPCKTFHTAQFKNHRC